jgi:hypothetical protein
MELKGAQCKELQDKHVAKTMQQNAALTWLDGAPATMAKRVPRHAQQQGHLWHYTHYTTVVRLMRHCTLSG